MRRIIHVVCLIGMCASAAMILVPSVYYRFTNPGMTETQLSITYWREYLIGVVGILVFSIGYEKPK